MLKSKQSGNAFVDQLSDGEARLLHRDWRFWARPEQLPPDGDWTTWLLLGGRGSGKTRAGAEWVSSLARKKIDGPIALIAESFAQARQVMLEGVSGILNISDPEFLPKFEPTRNRLIWPNGVIAQLMSAGEPESFRGPQFAAAWCDELAKWPKAQETWDMLQFALRVGDHPRQMVTTTPRPTRLIKQLLDDPNCTQRHMPTYDNADNLSPEFLRSIVGRYEGSVLGRQELAGELIEDREGALWTHEMLEQARALQFEAADRVVIAVDPSVRKGGKGDACGIIVASRHGERARIDADLTLKSAPPLVWAQRVVAAFHEYAADAIVAETNQGGALVEQVLHQVDPYVPVIDVTATRGKWLRAEPVAALYAQGRVGHAPGLLNLEDELIAFHRDGHSDGHSPDRLDAAVWALSELMLSTQNPRLRTT